MPIWTRGAESAEIVVALPAKTRAWRRWATAARPARRRHRRDHRLRQLSTRCGRARQRGRGQDRLRRPSHDAAPRTARATAISARPRRQGPTIAVAEGRDRRSSSARSAPIIIATRIPASIFHRRREADPRRRACRARCRAAARILKRGKPVTMHLTLVSQSRDGGHSGNVIAEVPGRDPTRRSSWSAAISTAGILAPARSTTAPGVAITTAAAKRIMDAGRPLRTIRVVWFGAEEPGGFGGMAYAEAHGREPLCHRRRKRFRRRPHLALQHASSARTRAGAMRSSPAALAPLGIVHGTTRATPTAPMSGRRSPPVRRGSRSARTAPAISTFTTRPTTRSTRSIRSSCGRTSRPGRRCWPSFGRN